MSLHLPMARRAEPVARWSELGDREPAYALIEGVDLVVEVGGVGLLVYVPDPISDQARAGRAIFLHTYLVVREESLALYGFETQEGRDYFQLLLGVSGIGPRLAVTILSTTCHTQVRLK